MQHQRCVCPQCGTTLRVKDRAYFNRPVPCPDCRTLVVIVPVGDDKLEVQLADVPVEESRKPATPAFPATVARAPSWTPNVIVVSWLAAFVVAAMIAGAALWPRSSRRTAVVDQSVEPKIPQDKIAKVEPEPKPAPSVDKDPVPAVDVLADVPIEPLLALEPEPIELDFPPADAALVARADGVLPPAAQPVREIDLEAALAQPLLEFRQDRSIPRRELLELLEEFLGAPIRYDAEELGDAAKSLEQLVSFTLERITVGDVLAKVLEGTGLTPHREPDGLRLKVTTEAPGP